MEIGILGPLVLSQHGRVATPSAPKTRSVLALLLLHTNQTVPVSALIQELWGADLPMSAHTTLQTYVVQLRKLLSRMLGIPVAEVARSVLVTTRGGYQFLHSSEEFDLRNYEQLANDGRRALAEGDNARAAAALLTACAQWRGPALADVRAGQVAEPQIKRLDESRLNTMEQSIEARLRLGRHQEVLSELAGLITQHRLHENLHAQLMVALHRSGRRQEALATFHDLRATMTEELGLEPSKRLHLLQQAILSEDPALEVRPRDDGLAQLLDQLTLQRSPN